MSDQLREGDKCPKCLKGTLKKTPEGKIILEKSDETHDYQKLVCDNSKCNFSPGHHNISTG